MGHMHVHYVCKTYRQSELELVVPSRNEPNDCYKLFRWLSRNLLLVNVLKLIGQDKLVVNIRLV